MNKLFLFSNGIGHFIRSYFIDGLTQISIPFKQDHIGDVLSSLQLCGDAKYKVPPSFTPSNANQTSLDIEPDAAMCSILRGLAGSDVKIKPLITGEVISGKLLGFDEIESKNGDSTYTSQYISIYYGGKVLRYNFLEVEVQFVSEAVQAEISKALVKNYEKVNPNNTLLDLSIEPAGENSPVKVELQYVVPIAAWKMRYSLRRDKEGCSLEATAIVDNNTEEDWNDFEISVVSGMPISFQTDISEIRCPTRKFVKLVEDTAIGNVGAERGGSARALRSVPSSVNLAQFASGEGNLDYYAEESFGAVAACGLAPAKIEQFDVQEVGDFAVFTSPTTLSIESNKSSVIPMFSRTVKDAELILLYKNTSNPTRPFRALKFVNPVDGHTLGKGKCTIFEENILAGECILETAKPGESQLLPFALETGVSVFRNVVDTRQDLIFIKFSNGVFTRKFRNSCKSLYRIKNNKNESFKFMIDYNFNYANVENVNLTLEEYTTETLNKGQRIIFTLEPNADIEFNLVESEVVNQEYMFKVNNLIEAVQQIFVTEDPSKFIPQFSQIKEDV